MIICIVLGCLGWNLELWKHQEELVSILRFLHKRPQSAKKHTWVNPPRSSKLQDKLRLIWTSLYWQRNEYGRQFNRYVRLARRDFQKVRPTLTLKEFCVMMLPGALMATPLAWSCIWLGMPHYCLAVSIMSEESARENPWTVCLLNSVDYLGVIYMAFTFYAGMYVGFFIESHCISRLKALVARTK